MRNITYFFHLYTNTMNPCCLVKEAYEAARRDWLCGGCATPKNPRRSIDARIQEVVPDNPPFNLVNGCTLGLVKQDFLEAVGLALVDRDLILGCLYGPNGDLIQDWVTFQGKHQLIVRGTRHVSHRRCSICGRLVYFAMGKRYLYPMPSQEVSIFESDYNGIIVRESLFSRLKIDAWPKLKFDRLSVPKEPKDLLGSLD